jgi:hypothetical protein
MPLVHRELIGITMSVIIYKITSCTHLPLMWWPSFLVFY